MALHHHMVITALLFSLVLARVDLSTCHVLKGSLTCLDCKSHYDLSGFKVLVKCSQVKKLAMATTEEDGSFKTELPSDTPTTPSPVMNCQAKLLGGPNQLYASKNNIASKVIKDVHEHDSYTISTPINFYTSCPNSSNKDAKCGAHKAAIGSSKTVELPLPREWGLAPSSYYINPFIPIIGIP